MTQARAPENPTRQSDRWRIATIGGLLVSAAGIAVLWAAGVPFPFDPPPGIPILVAGAGLVLLAPWRWVPVIGAALGLFIAVGFVISSLINGTGFTNISGGAGAGAVAGTVIQLLGAATAVLAGIMSALRRSASAA